MINEVSVGFHASAIVKADEEEKLSNRSSFDPRGIGLDEEAFHVEFASVSPARPARFLERRFRGFPLRNTHRFCPQMALITGLGAGARTLEENRVLVSKWGNNRAIVTH